MSPAASDASNRRAMITGASEGIGRAFARRLAREGYRVTAVARNEARLRSLVEEIGARHDYVVADLSDAAQMQSIGARLEAERHHLLVNNAGVGAFGRFDGAALDEQRALMRLNMEAPVVLAHAFLRRAEAGDALINVASTVAFQPIPASGLYAASKSFVATLSECLWYEQKARGVYVMGLCPGPTETEFQKRAGAGHHKPPKALLQTPEQVVDEAMVALAARRTPTVTCGRPNRVFTLVNRFRTRRAVVSQMGRMFPDLPAEKA